LAAEFRACAITYPPTGEACLSGEASKSNDIA